MECNSRSRAYYFHYQAHLKASDMNYKNIIYTVQGQKPEK